MDSFSFYSIKIAVSEIVILIRCGILTRNKLKKQKQGIDLVKAEGRTLKQEEQKESIDLVEAESEVLDQDKLS